LPFTHNIIETSLKVKVTKTISADDALAIAEKTMVTPDRPEGTELKLCIEDKRSTLESLQKSRIVEKLEKMGIRVVLTPTDVNTLDSHLEESGFASGSSLPCQQQSNLFWKIFADLVEEEALNHEDPKIIEVANNYIPHH
jgi:hypothetical protein